MDSLQDYLRERADAGLIAWRCQLEAAERFGLSIAEVEAVILDNGLLPARYQRNRQMISVEQQRRLFASKVAVVGAGGLGGYILEQLARLGVGTLVVIDNDVFEENNLNRQLLSAPRHLGRAKVEIAAERIAEINPAVTLEPRQVLLDGSNGARLLAGVSCVVDAVDNVSARLEIEEVCEKLQLPLVHGAIAGWYGHVTTVLPGDRTLKKIYRHWQGGKGIEAQLGNPSFTPALAASLQVSEVCKILLRQGRLLRHRQLVFNVFDMEIDEIEF
ncbi:molybdopterin/thiamine biosynthesis adenylyltransferase [Geothermobacter ehrlichii]|uniref:Molybdopterin/thiamine biosynthesis adenylyltransferase n=1 Tax=Geothermobacter ehrlichii TaxID=213224 RepID=A0A5D3WL65_9BACT|nr:HesA/MoeB/ThiF family protein [Geothermobacter ehrlichii]TYO99177.1 molybdopterin/thiamine biosynthesis adenylyltransferase [Geothermobacter ehrlichii]